MEEKLIYSCFNHYQIRRVKEAIPNAFILFEIFYVKYKPQFRFKGIAVLYFEWQVGIVVICNFSVEKIDNIWYNQLILILIRKAFSNQADFMKRRKDFLAARKEWA